MSDKRPGFHPWWASYFMGAARILPKVLDTKESGRDLKAGAIQYIEKMPRYLFIHLSMMHGGN